MSKVTAADVGAWMLSALALAFGAWGLHVGWNHGILDVHPWRQAHTAISAYEMAVRDGPFWTYRTPIFGPPWQWPLELPVYQWLAAETSRLLPLDLERAGRTVSVAFYVAAFIPGWFALEVFEIAPRHRPVVLAMIWASPLYIFWSRTFMIESTAVCFAVAYFALVHRATRAEDGSVSVPLLGAAAVTGAVAGTVKVTAFAAFVAAAAWLLAVRSWRIGWPRRTVAAALVTAILIPTAVTGAWLAFADRQKAGSPLASEVDWAAERQQRFGTLAERFTARSWYSAPANAILGGTRHAVIASPAVFTLAFLATFRHRRRFAACVACLAVYVLPIAVFMRLFLVHVYYGYENGLLLAVVAGCGIVTCLEGPVWLRWPGVALFAAALTAMSTNYLAGYYVDQESGALAPDPITTLTRTRTAPDEVLLIYGVLHSPTLPYEAQRRAIMDSKDRSVDDPAIRTSLAQLDVEGARIGAVVTCGDSRQHTSVRANIRRLGFGARPSAADGNCDLYLRR